MHASPSDQVAAVSVALDTYESITLSADDGGEKGSSGGNIEAIRSLRRMLVLGLIVAVPLFFLPELSFDAYNQPKLTLTIVGVCLAVTLRVVEWALSPGDRAGVSALMVPAVALVAPLTLSWLAADERGWMVLGRHQRFMGLLPYVLFVVLGFLVADAFRGDPRPVVVALTVSTTLAAAYLIWQIVGLDPFWKPGETSVEYPPSTIGHFTVAGAFVALGVGPAMWLWIRGGRGRQLAAAATAVLGVGVIMSFSQAAWAAAAAAGAITLSYLLGEEASWLRRVGWVVVIAIAAVTVGSVVASRFLDLDELATARTRAGTWAGALRMTADSPVVGSGPNSFYLTGESYRSLEDGVTTEATPSDDPHSVPIAMLANAGVLGLVGFLAVAAWGLRRSVASITHDPVAIPLLGVIVAYLVQALVSIDLPVLRLGLWAALGGIAALSPSLRMRVPVIPRPARMVTVAVTAAGAIALSVAAVAFLLVPDLRADRARDLRLERRSEAAVEQFESAIALRADPEYRIELSSALGDAAFNDGAAGDLYIDRLRRATGYLDHFSDLRGEVAAGYAFHLSQWFDRGLEFEALVHFRRAMRLGPSHIGARVGAAEALMVLERDEEALDLLDPVARVAGENLGDFWGSYALILAATGDRAGAEDALQVLPPDGCASELATEMLRLTSAPGVGPGRDFLFKVRFVCDLPQLYFFATLVPEEQRSPYVPKTTTD